MSLNQLAPVKGRAKKSDLLNRYMFHEQYPLWLAINHHRTHTNKRMTFHRHLYLAPILADSANQRVVMKGTQGGFSECLCIITWASAKQGNVVFYVLPTHLLMERFVSNRFEKSLAYTRYYREQRTSGKSQSMNRKVLIDNKSLKDIGEGVVNFVGSGSDVPFVEIPADWLVVDEADKCDAKRLEMAKERLGHASNPVEIYAGNPTFTGSFLDNKYKDSTMSEWTIKGDCGHHIQIDFFEHVIRKIDDQQYVLRDEKWTPDLGRDIYPICDKCGKPFDRFGDGVYVDQQNSDISGKRFFRLFSGNSTVLGLVRTFDKATEDDYLMQRFYNSDLGLPFLASGSKVFGHMLDDCVQDYLMPDKNRGKACLLGCDVGKKLHVRVNELQDDGSTLAVYIGSVKEFDEVAEIYKRYNCAVGVIDSRPETRLSKLLSLRFKGMFICDYIHGVKDIVDRKKILKCDRTGAMDAVKSRIMTQQLGLPKNARSIPEYYAHMEAPVRVFNEDKDTYSWEEGSLADHFFHAEVYCEKARQILIGFG